jgi:hypothetical protein
LRLSAASPDGSVRVTVRADGTVSELQFTEKVRTLPLNALSEQILSTMRRAQSGIADKVSEVMTEQLGDEDQQTRTVTLDGLRSRFPEQDLLPEEPGNDTWDLPDEGPSSSAAAPPAPPAPPPPVAPPAPPAPPRRRPPARDDEDDDFDPFSD